MWLSWLVFLLSVGILVLNFMTKGGVG